MSTFKALLVGVARYEGFDSLVGCDRDALRMRDFLVAHYGCDIPDERVLLNEAATRAAIVRAVSSFVADVVETQAQALFYYSGHGDAYDVQGSLESAILPYDWEQDRFMAITSGTFADVLTPLHGSAQRFIGIFDTCHSGDMGPLEFGGASGVVKSPPPSLAQLDARASAKAHPFFAPFDGAIALTACAPTEITEEVPRSPFDPIDEPGGLFTYALLHVLAGNPRATLGSIRREIQALYEAAGLSHMHPQILPLATAAATSGRIGG